MCRASKRLNSMQLVHSNQRKASKPAAKLASLLATIREAQLREWVERIAVPRHFGAEPVQNRATADRLTQLFGSWGYRVERQGCYANIVARPQGEFSEMVLVGAHYDSVPMCPGADDNGSAVAAMLGCAAACALWRPIAPALFVAFNCEEDGLRGSRDFVESYLPLAPFRVRCAHVLEMVGYASSAPGSQRIPTELPLRIRDTGDFLGLLANGLSCDALEFVLPRAGAYVPDLPVTGLKVRLGLEQYFPVLGRSDHVPFWEKDIPAVMWTDTSEFRNTNYHRDTDTPDTLDYAFLARVTRLLTATVIEQR
jgi:Zn-dependent M28 family amino/carboxypeptidase